MCYVYVLRLRSVLLKEPVVFITHVGQQISVFHVPQRMIFAKKSHNKLAFQARFLEASIFLVFTSGIV